MNRIKRFWEGDLSLKESFWSWFMLPESILYFILNSDFILQDSSDVLLFMTVKVFYSVFAIIGAWRSATKYILEKKIKKTRTTWGFVAKGCMVASAIENVVYVWFFYLIMVNSPLLKIIAGGLN